MVSQNGSDIFSATSTLEIEAPQPKLRVIGKVYADLDVENPDYPDYTITIWTNAPAATVRKFLSSVNTDTDLVEQVGQLIVAHNNWSVDGVTVLPPPNKVEFWDSIPQDLAGSILVRLVNYYGSDISKNLSARVRS